MLSRPHVLVATATSFTTSRSWGAVAASLARNWSTTPLTARTPVNCATEDMQNPAWMGDVSFAALGSTLLLTGCSASLAHQAQSLRTQQPAMHALMGSFRILPRVHASLVLATSSMISSRGDACIAPVARKLTLRGSMHGSPLVQTVHPVAPVRTERVKTAWLENSRTLPPAYALDVQGTPCRGPELSAQNAIRAKHRIQLFMDVLTALLDTQCATRVRWTLTARTVTHVYLCQGMHSRLLALATTRARQAFLSARLRRSARVLQMKLVHTALAMLRKYPSRAVALRQRSGLSAAAQQLLHHHTFATSTPQRMAQRFV